MAGLPGTRPDVAAAVGGFCLALVYFAAGLGVYLLGQRTGHERLRDAGRTLTRLSPLPSVLGLALAGLAAVPGSGFLLLLGGVAAVLLALGVPVLSVTSALDDHAVD
jgi:hypothetical protein